jgi:NADPH-dependent glutamate synthase beta subunit-like oxidoreductase
MQENIFQAGWSYKCPTYIQSTPPCQGSCPSGEDIRGYLNIVRGIEKPPLGADGKPVMPWQEYAWRRLTEANPLPAVMGRVCPAPCESGCNRNQVEDHVGINSVEHYLGEYALKNNLQFKKPEKLLGKKVAILGGGPAGLSVAYQLALKGYSCTIFDDHEHLGGMMRYGIPGYRTPRDILDAEIQRILNLGVEVKLNCKVGVDIALEQIRKDYDAVFLGLGAQGGRALPAEGADNVSNVVTATAFLKAFNDGRLKTVGKNVVVVGGGDTSMDVATVARRLGHIENVKPTDWEGAIAGQLAQDVASISNRKGADVVLTSVFPVDKMMASPGELEHAQSEGIEIMGGWMPVAVVKGADGRATALRVCQCEAKMVGGQLNIKKIEGSEKDLPADLIVSAIGQTVDLIGLEEFNNGKGAVSADKNYQVQGKPGVYAGGDVIRPHLLTTAIGHGAIAADGIDQYLQGLEVGRRPKVDVHVFDLMRKYVEKGVKLEDIKEPLRGTDTTKSVHNFDNRSDRYIIPHTELFLGHFQYTPRNKRHITHLNKETALGNFEERLDPLDDKQVVAEAKRCMSCGLCFECDNCVVYCPQTAVYRVKKTDSMTGRYVATDYDKCIGCHICHDVCPTGYIQMGLGE